jgi:hypothetical protein
MAGMTDPLQVKAAKADMSKFRRRRVCSACLVIMPEEARVLGYVSGEVPCSNCGCSPCNGFMVQGGAP